nr:MAG TPA: hypothetical protein [Caudoviricetes sp.]
MFQSAWGWLLRVNPSHLQQSLTYCIRKSPD